jgi:hypothetical protein
VPRVPIQVPEVPIQVPEVPIQVLGVAIHVPVSASTPLKPGKVRSKMESTNPNIDLCIVSLHCRVNLPSVGWLGLGVIDPTG